MSPNYTLSKESILVINTTHTLLIILRLYSITDVSVIKRFDIKYQ